MSNLFKSGFPGIKSVDTAPFVIDGNKRKINIPDAKGKIIRPFDDTKMQEENLGDSAISLHSEELLGEAMNIAKELREDAVVKANLIIEEAKQEAQQIKDTAYKEGYDKGFEEGSMEAMKRTDAYMENLHKEQELLFQKNQETVEQNIADAQKKVVDFSCVLIEKLTGILVDEYKPVMIYIINNALNESDNSKQFTIKVGEDNYLYLLDNFDRLTGATNPNISIELYSDSKLNNRQCIIESENGIIDLSMDIQVRNLITAIKMLSE